MPADRLLTVQQAADRLNVTVRSIRYMIETRSLTFVKLGRRVRIPTSAIDDLIQQGTVPSRKGAA